MASLQKSMAAEYDEQREGGCIRDRGRGKNAIGVGGACQLIGYRRMPSRVGVTFNTILRKAYARGRLPPRFLAFFALPTLFFAPSLLGVIRTSGVYLYSGLAYGTGGRLLPGQPTIDPNYGFTSEALGVRAANDLFSGQLPLWNPYEGFGAPLLGEMQAAALFPPTWLQILPHGQVLELALLQLLAGLGTFLFLCKLGVDRRAALAAGLLFQLNGVFSWLRNAIYNPIAFLPWLFLVIEALYVSAARNDPFERRFRWLVLGGAAAALAVCAGFPEEVYLYTFLLLLWAGLRFCGLKATARWIYLTDLGLVSLLGLLLSLPALLAFVDFLPEAALGGHDTGSYGVFLPPAAVLQYLLPYIYGTIFSVADPGFSWGATGGYIGVMPVILAVVALQLRERRALKIILALWIVVAVGVSHGIPGIYQAFMHLPLMKVAATFRYLNVSWIFCFVILAGLSLDELVRSDWATIRRALLVGIVCGCTATAISAAFAWPVLTRAFSEFRYVRLFVTFSFLILVCTLGVLLAVTRIRNAKVVVSTLAAVTVFEAALYFSIPYLSYPRNGEIDSGLVEFLRTNAGFQRVAATDGDQLSPNYGSYFEISQLNWNDLPVPRLAVQYVQQRLDPYVTSGGTLYLPESLGHLTEEQQIKRKALFAQRLNNYARAGVKYVLSNDDPGAYPAISLGSDWRHPVRLEEPGQRIEIVLPFPSQEGDEIAGLSVLIGTYGGKSNGRLGVELCRRDDCTSGLIDLASARDNSLATVRFDLALAVQPNDKLQIALTKVDGDQAVALWMGPLGAAQVDVRIHEGPPSVRPESAPVLQLLGANAGKSRLVYRGKNTNVFELSGVRPYFDSEECKLTPVTRDEVRAECPRAGRLVRLELAMSGWRAFVGKQEVSVRKTDDIFQDIDLPEGVSTVHFVYAPPGVRPAVWISTGALVAIPLGLGWFSFFFRNGKVRRGRDFDENNALPASLLGHHDQG
jgi:hypothetical protein